MKAKSLLRIVPVAATLTAVGLSPARPQGTRLDVGYGMWWASDSISVVYSASILRPLLGPFDYGIGATHLRGPSGTDPVRLTGGELSVGMFRDGSGLYAVAAAGLGMEHSRGDFDAQWSAGVGYELRLFGGLSAGLDARYRVEDRASRGFWRLNPADARGLIVQARLTFGLGGGSGTRRARRPDPPVRGTPETVAGPTVRPPRVAEGAGDAALLRNAVVATAMEVMGSPYRWGGEGEGGFDCSGLIQFAYGEHGLILPRTSRDQARMGSRVNLTIADLRPGDILGFSESGGGVTHVGLYVGDGMFIHSSSSGVTLSSLTSPEGDGRWWQQRWVQARRLIN